MPMDHLITLVGSSLEILRFSVWRIQTYEILASIPLPRLTFFEDSTAMKVPTHENFAPFRNIRTLIMSFLGPDPVPSTAFPNLTYLSAPHGVGKVLLPGRPVHIYRMHDVHYSRPGAYLKGPLVQLAPYAQHVKELHLWIEASPWELVGFLALHFPNIVRLHLGVNEFNLLDHGEPPQYQADVHLSLREFDIGFGVTEDWPFPDDNCWFTLTRLTEVCPALEIIRFGALFPIDGGEIDERNVPLDWLKDIRRTAGGEWEERKWGV